MSKSDWDEKSNWEKLLELYKEPKTVSDYGDFNVMNFYGSDWKYIITENQKPKPNNVEQLLLWNNLWTKIWDRKLKTVVLLEKYPEELKLDQMTLKKEKVVKNPKGYNVISITISKVGDKTPDERKVVLFEYNHWKNPCPSTIETVILYNLIEDLNHTENNEWREVLKTKQIIVHCGTDITRSIVFVILDAMIEKIETDKNYDLTKVEEYLYKFIYNFGSALFLKDIKQYQYLLTATSVYGDCHKANDKQWKKASKMWIEQVGKTQK
jgi:protein tyrosine phosphatase